MCKKLFRWKEVSIIIGLDGRLKVNLVAISRNHGVAAKNKNPKTKKFSSDFSRFSLIFRWTKNFEGISDDVNSSSLLLFSS